MMNGEPIVIAGWPVQFLPAGNPPTSETLEHAVEKSVADVTARVRTAEPSAARFDRGQFNRPAGEPSNA